LSGGNLFEIDRSGREGIPKEKGVRKRESWCRQRKRGDEATGGKE
jgi:hypothetical protein